MTMIIPITLDAQLKRSQAIIEHHHIELDDYENTQRLLFAKHLDAVDSAWNQYRLLKVAHQHIIGPRKPYDPNEKWFSTTAVCVICHESFDWWCPKSESGRCEYDWPNTGEICIHCGDAEERK